MFKTIAVILAAGQGSRMGTKINKQYLHLLDKPVLSHTLEVFEKESLIDGIVIVTREDEIELCYEQAIKPYEFKKVIKVVAGGKERQDSVYRGLKSLPSQCKLVVVHDGARPLVTNNLISQAVTIAGREGAAIAAVPVKDTIKRVVGGLVVETIPRQEIWAIQTPQVFTKELIIKAYESAYEKGVYGTDDASLVEMLGEKVSIVPGSYENIKITIPEDLDIGKAILAGRKGSDWGDF